MGSYIWWGKIVLIAVISLFFLLFGIESLIGSFYLKNPLEFIMYFFSASLIILVSLVGIIYPVSQIRVFFKPKKCNDDSEQ
jgi:hypothetical protein